MNENRPALWAILGVVVGFSLPMAACAAVFLLFSFSLTSLGNQTAPTTNVPVHISGPSTGPAVAIIDITGPIVSGRSPAFTSATVAASGDITSLIRAAAEDSDVRAVVLAVNSPGGGVVPSDEIYHVLQDLQIPVVVQMGDVAASGAYYLSMAADSIIANPNTLTGSIGVISTFPEAAELLEKVGVEFNVITSGEVKDFGSPYRPMEPAERAYWQSIINEVYQDFLEVVAQGRGLDLEAVRGFADGQVFTGRQALEAGLIDELGHLDDAIKKAGELGGISDTPRVIRYQKFSPLGSFLGETARLGGVELPAAWLDRLLAPTLEFRWVP